MRNKLVLLAALVAFPAVSFANNNVGTCGWGSKLFDGQGGIAPQVLAVTTNGTSGNQTFGITSGTSGCTQDGVVRSTWKTAAFIDANMNRLARDISRGEGESLDSLALLVKVEAADRQEFDSLLQKNFDRLFPTEQVTSEELMASLRGVLAEHEGLARYTVNV